MTSDPVNARNDTDDSTADEEGQLANPGPIPAEAEDSSDTGEGHAGDLTAEAGPGLDDDTAR